MDFAQAFPEVMKRGGFDAIVGNPPYIRIQTLQETTPRTVKYLKDNYTTASKGNYDIYVVFIEQALRRLSESGRLGYIVPHKFFNAQYGAPVRKVLADGKHLSHVVHFGDAQVFKGATTYTALLFADKTAREEMRLVRVKDLSAWQETNAVDEGIISTANITANEWNFTIGESAGLFEKLSAMPTKLGDIAFVFVGLQTSADTVFLFKDSKKADGKLTTVESKELGKFVQVETELLKPVIRSGSIGRYWAIPTALVLFPYEFGGEGKFCLISESKMKQSYPEAWSYLCLNKKLLADREHGKFAKTGWYQLYPKNLDLWEQHKIMLPYMITRLAAYNDDESNYFVNVTTGGFGVVIPESHGSTKYMTGVFNSRLLDWFMKNVSTTFHGGYFAANKQFLIQLPIRTINFTDKADRARHDRMVSLVEQMLAAKKQLQLARTDRDQTFYTNKCHALDRQIDALVYELYELTTEEIALVEASA